ncbi:MAG: hypothetical protein MUP55_02705 [Candidatus Aenigmarchaeota archaeon]|nr:hypothetical protein [Candidatus Aenigmarchaeota archaeon]
MRRNKDMVGVGDASCKELNLPPKECVERKIEMFCGLLPDNGGECKEMFNEYRQGRMTAEELSEELKDKFGADVLKKARETIKEKLGAP